MVELDKDQLMNGFLQDLGHLKLTGKKCLEAGNNFIVVLWPISKLTECYCICQEPGWKRSMNPQRRSRSRQAQYMARGVMKVGIWDDSIETETFKN